MTTKILALTDALGQSRRFRLLPGQRFDTVGVAPLIEGVEFGALLADKAFDSDWIVAELNARGAQIVISQHPRRNAPLAIDIELYKARHLIDIDQSWRLSRLCGGGGGVVGKPWRQAAPGRRRGSYRLQRRDRLGIGAHQHGAFRAAADVAAG